MLFRVKIQGFNPITREPILGLCLFTPPIKVISKPEQIKKKPSKKRTVTDTLVDTVSRIEKKQEEQRALIEKLIQAQSHPVSVKKQKTFVEAPEKPRSKTHFTTSYP
jgi:hypothetical protein